MKTNNLLFPITKTLKSLGLTAALLALPLAPIYAANVPALTECDDEDACTTCDGKDGTVNDDGECIGSFNMGISIGFAKVLREGDFLNYSRMGVIEGQAGKGSYRSFDDVRNSFLDTSNYTDNKMQSLNAVHGSIDADLYDPNIFSYLPLPGTEFIESNGALKQALTDSAFTDIEILIDGFIVRSWSIEDLVDRTKVNNLYVIPTTDPIKSTQFKNPDHPANSNRLVIHRMENFSGSSPHYETKLYNQTNPDQLIVEHYSGQDLTGDLMQRLTLNYVARGSRPWDYTYERIIERSTNVNGVIGSLVTVTHNREIYQDYSISTAGGDRNGKRLMSKITAYGTSEAQTSTYDYYLDPSNVYLNGRLKSKSNPDGSWEYWEYVDALGAATAQEVKYSSWKDVPLSSYQNGMKQETIITQNEVNRIVTIQGQQISKEKYTSNIDSSSGRLSYNVEKWSGDEWSVHTTCYEGKAATTASAGRPICRTFPDGTAETISYTQQGDDLTVAIARGDNSTGTVGAPIITAGKKTVSVYNQGNVIISKEIYDIESNLLISSELALDFDAAGRITKKIFNNNPDDFELMQYGCCGLEFSQDRTGATKTFFRDNLKRVYRVVSQSSTTDTPVITSTAFNGLTETTTRSDATTTLLVSETTKTLGGLTTTRLSPDANGDATPETTTRQTIYSPAGGSTVTTTYSDGTTTSSITFIDGSTKSSTDQLGNTTTMDKGTHTQQGGGLWSLTTAANTTQSTKTYADQLGRTFKSENADSTYQSMSYYDFSTADPGAMGKLATTADEDEVATPGTGSLTTYSYCPEGHRCTTITSLPSGQTMTSTNNHDVITDPDLGIATRNWTTVNGITTSTSLRSADGYSAKQTTLAGTSTSSRTVPVDGAWTVTSTSPDGQVSLQTYTDGTVEEVSNLFNDGTTTINSTTYTYDAFNRTLTTTDSRTGVTTIGGYLENGAVTSVTTNNGADTTAYTYDVMGRTTVTTLPDASTTHTSYTARGETLATWGSQTYARLYQYDALGRMSQLRTYQALAHGTEPTVSTTGHASTTWLYHPQRGFLTEKNYDGETDNGTTDADYTYTASGRLATRTWERGTTTTYSYDQGQLSSVVYTADPTNTPAVYYSYDNFGRPATVTQAGNLHTYAYDPATLVLDTETVSYDTNADGTPDFTRVIDRDQDALLRSMTVSVMTNPTGGTPQTDHSTGYTYDPAGRLHTVTNNTGTFTYGYLANSASLLETVTGPALKVINTYEPHRNVLSTKNNSVNSVNSVQKISQFDYTVNSLGQRTGLTTTGTAFTTPNTLAWNYNARGELTTADHSDNAQDRAFQYDGIGNRQKSANSLTLPTANNYTTNSLNQYTGILGLPTRTHDADGNLTSGVLPVDENSTFTIPNSTFIWDAENRLVAVTKPSGDIIRFAYDYQSRRISKAVDGSPATYYIYDGWNMIADYQLQTSNLQLQTTYTWGQDLSGSMQGAGGVGGLLAVNEFTIQNSTFTIQGFYPAYDGNGNISEYLDSTGTTVAHYEYDSFGNTTVSGGSKASDFEHKFSTKPQDAETGLYYYGYRYYDPVTGRWPSRDPIEEMGGVNLYGFVNNNVVIGWDFLGLNYGCCAGKKMKRRQKCCAGEIMATGPNNPCCIKDGRAFGLRSILGERFG